MSAYVLANLLEKLQSNDSDFRFMALTDLSKEMEMNSFAFIETANNQIEENVIQALVTALNDSNSEVQNQAIKWFGSHSLYSLLSKSFPPLSQKLKNKFRFCVKSLVLLLESEKEAIKDVGALALKSVLINVPSSHSDLSIVILYTLPALLSNLKKDAHIPSLDLIEIVSEILSRYGASVVNASPDARSLQAAVLDMLLGLLDYTRVVVRKKAIHAIGALAAIAFDDIFHTLTQSLLKSASLHAASKTNDKLVSILQTLSTVYKVDSTRMASITESLITSCIDYSSFEDDEVKEQALLSLEVFIAGSPTHIDKVMAQGLALLSYDPNYIADVDMDDDSDEDIESVAYSDDDDVSFKVRRAATRLLSRLVCAHSLFPTFYTTIAPCFIARFGDREESVCGEAIAAFGVVVEATPRDLQSGPGKKRKGGNGQVYVHGGLLRDVVPALVDALKGLVVGKEAGTVLAALGLVKSVVGAVEGGLESCMSALFAALEPRLVGRSGEANTNIKISLLQLLSVILEWHDVDVLSPFMELVGDAIVDSTMAKFYKVRSEALVVVDTLVLNLCQRDQMATRYENLDVLQSIFDAVWSLLDGRELEAEVTEKAINSLALLVSSTSDLMGPAYLEKTLDKLLELTRSEMSRLYAAKAVTILSDVSHANSPTAPSQKWTLFIPEIQPLITKTNRAAAVIALTSIISLVKKCNSALSKDTIQSLLMDATAVLGQSDQASLFPLCFDLLATIISLDVIDQFSCIKSNTIPNVVGIITLQSHSVAGGAGLSFLVALWKAMVCFEDETDIYELGVQELFKMASSSHQSSSTPISREAFKVMAKCVATFTKSRHLSRLIDSLLSHVRGALDESLQRFSLLCIGELGLEVDMSVIAPDLHTAIDQLLHQSSDDLKNASALCLGNMAVCNPTFYLPRLVENIRTGKQKYYYAVAVNEMVSHLVPGRHVDFVSDLWKVFVSVAGDGDGEEGTRSLAADCMGKLVLLDPSQFLMLLQECLGSQSEWVRGCAVAAFRYTLAHSSAAFDAKLYPCVGMFLAGMGDSSLGVRKMALTALSSAMHSKPDLLRHVMNDLIPLLYKEAEFKAELVVIVQMGPFQHKVDNGLDNRKIALDCMSSLLDGLNSRLLPIDFPLFLQKVLSSLCDPSHEIKIAANSLLVKLSKMDPPVSFDRDTPGLISGLRQNVFVKTKETAVKQEIENNRALVVSCLKTVRVLDAVQGGRRVEWNSFIQELTALFASYSSSMV